MGKVIVSPELPNNVNDEQNSIVNKFYTSVKIKIILIEYK